MVQYTNPKYDAAAAKKVTAPRPYTDTTKSSSTTSTSSSSSSSSSVGSGSIKLSSSGTYTQTITSGGSSKTTTGTVAGSPADVYSKTGSSRQLSTTPAQPQVEAIVKPAQTTSPFTPASYTTDKFADVPTRSYNAGMTSAPVPYTPATLSQTQFADVQTKSYQAKRGLAIPQPTNKQLGETIAESGYKRESPSQLPQPIQPSILKQIKTEAGNLAVGFGQLPVSVGIDIKKYQQLRSGVGGIDISKAPVGGYTQGTGVIDVAQPRTPSLFERMQIIPSKGENVITAVAKQPEFQEAVVVGGLVAGGTAIAPSIGKVGLELGGLAAKQIPKYLAENALTGTKIVGQALGAQLLTEEAAKSIEQFNYPPELKEKAKSPELRQAYFEGRQYAEQSKLPFTNVLMQNLPFVTKGLASDRFEQGVEASLRKQGISENEIPTYVALAKFQLTVGDLGEAAALSVAGFSTEITGSRTLSETETFSPKVVANAKKTAEDVLATISNFQFSKEAQAMTQAQRDQFVLNKIREATATINKAVPPKVREAQMKSVVASVITPLGVAEGVSQQISASVARDQEIKPSSLIIAGTAGGLTAGYLGARIAGAKGVSKAGLTTFANVVDPTEAWGDLLAKASRGELVPEIKASYNQFAELAAAQARSKKAEISITPTPSYYKQEPLPTERVVKQAFGLKEPVPDRVRVYSADITLPTTESPSYTYPGSPVKTSALITQPTVTTPTPSSLIDVYELVIPVSTSVTTPTSTTTPTSVNTQKSVPTTVTSPVNVPIEVPVSVPTTVTTPTSVPISVPVSVPTTVTTPVPVIVPITPYMRKKEKRKLGSFAVQVRTKGQFRQVGGLFETEREALGFGGKIVGSTAAATFKIGRSTQEATQRFTQGIKAQDFYTKRAKTGETLYIQRAEKRISTAGEKQEITFKGIIASKQRKGKTLFG